MVNLLWLNAGHGSLKPESFTSLISRLIFFALHLELLSPGKVVIDPALKIRFFQHAPLPLVASLSKHVPRDQPLFIHRPIHEELFILIGPYIWNLANY